MDNRYSSKFTLLRGRLKAINTRASAMRAVIPETTMLYIIFLAVIVYLAVGTGRVSDDFMYYDYRNWGVSEDGGIMKLQWLLPAAKLFFNWHFFNESRLFILDILKVSYLFMSFYLISKFFGIYVDKFSAALASFIFIFFPSHDSTAYWIIGSGLMLSFSFYLYAFYLAHINKLKLSFIFAVAGSIISYGSTVIAISLFLLCLVNKEIKKGLVILVPNVLFAAYFSFMTAYIFKGSGKIAAHINIISLAKNFILQALTFIDAIIGPSMWLKIYYSFYQLSAVSIFTAVLFLVLLHRVGAGGNNRYNPKLIMGLTCLALLSFMMFSLTGRYPQIAFNLGNRVTIFGSLLAAYLVVLIPLPRFARSAILAILIFSIFGISDHWKEWTNHQEAVLANMKNNRDMQDYNGARPIYVSGNQYSRYGKLAHIEFLSEESVTGPFFELAIRKGIVGLPINKRFIYEDGKMVDKKYNTARDVEDYINVYDSERDLLLRIKTGDINSYIASSPDYKRHWIQSVDNEFFRAVLRKMVPRLGYAL